MTIEKMKEKQEHNQMMIDLASSLSYVKFDDVKECTTTKKMCDKLAQIHGGDKHVLRDKVKRSRGKFNDMRIKEGENVSKCYGKIKEVRNSIKGFEGIISDETIISKVLRTLLVIYVIRLSSIQEFKCTCSNDLTLDSLSGRLNAFELLNFDNHSLASI